ncbi:MAG: hypothetical protein ABEH66_00345 [Halobacteriales archaeon]
MISILERAALYALYQASIVVGIALMPLALLLGRLGVTLPVHRVVDRLGDAYANA